MGREVQPETLPSRSTDQPAPTFEHLPPREQHLQKQDAASWALERKSELKQKEESFDFDSALSDTDIYAQAGSDTSVRDKTAGSNSDSTVPEPDKHFESIDKLLKERGSGTDETILKGELPEPLPRELERLPGATRENLEKVREEIRTNNLDPRAAVSGLMKDVRVLGLGESHLGDNPQREFGAEIMKDLAQNGATHLAIEMDDYKQPVLDEFMKTGNLDVSKLPPLLQDADYVKMLHAARDAGLQLVAVDNHHAPKGRDQAMASNVGKILEADPSNKVVFWAGSAHLSRLSDPDVNQNAKSASQLLEQKYKTATVVPNINGFDSSTLTSVAPDVTRPTLLPIDKMPQSSEMRSSGLDIPKSWYRDNDFVILYPKPGNK